MLTVDGASRVKAGEWLGPWVLCHTLEAVMKKMEPGSLHVHVHVVSQPGGAVPVLYTARSVALFLSSPTVKLDAMSCRSAWMHCSAVALLHSRHPVAADAI